jgi:hypothetical protein
VSAGVPASNVLADDDNAGIDGSPEALMEVIAASLTCLHDVDQAAYRRTINLLMHQLEIELAPYAQSLSDHPNAVPHRLLLRRIE